MIRLSTLAYSTRLLSSPFELFNYYFSPFPFTKILVKCQQAKASDLPFYHISAPQKSSFFENFWWRHCMWFVVWAPPNQKSWLCLWLPVRYQLRTLTMTDFLLVDWKLTVLSFFLHGSFVLRICPIKFVEYAWPQNNLRNKSKIFFFNAFLFFGTRLFLVTK